MNPNKQRNIRIISENKIQKTSNLNNNIESEIKKEEKIKKTKGENERTFICKICGKIYSSYPALYNHTKQKHNTINERKRGRPRKNSGETNAEKLKYNPLDSSYFLRENRKGKTNLEDFENSINQAFKEIYFNNSNFFSIKKLPCYNNINLHPFLKKFLSDKHDVYIKIVNETEICDNVFMDYLNKISLLVNPNYFTKLIIFITLFREFINFKKNSDNNLFEYTSINSAENIPFLSNEFINDFFSNDNLLFGFNKEESIDLILNFCHWIYINNFTSFKLSLISTNK